MFTGGSNSNIPKNLEACMTTDYVTDQLFSWANKLRIWGSVCACVALFFGIITAYNATEFVNDSQKLMVMIETAAPWFVSVIVIELVFEFFRTVVQAIAHIVHNTKVTANVALLNASIGTAGETKKASGTGTASKPASQANPAFGIIPNR